MGLSFERVDEILKSYGLVSHTIKNGKCTGDGFEDKVLNTKKKNVATQATALINGGVEGYLYIDHLKEYDTHPRKTKMGHIPIGQMTEELTSTIEKVIKGYR